MSVTSWIGSPAFLTRSVEYLGSLVHAQNYSFFNPNQHYVCSEFNFRITGHNLNSKSQRQVSCEDKQKCVDFNTFNSNDFQIRFSVPKMFQQWLEQVNTRFAASRLNITILFDDINYNHANILLIDLENQQAIRIDPFGSCVKDGSIRAKAMKKLDQVLNKYFNDLQIEFRTTNFYGPQCRQELEKEFTDHYDPQMGFCSIWTIIILADLLNLYNYQNNDLDVSLKIVIDNLHESFARSESANGFHLGPNGRSSAKGAPKSMTRFVEYHAEQAMKNTK